MDLTFQLENGKFNYRVCALVRRDGEILAMHDERSPYYYLPGGRVRLGETAEHAIQRELREELHISAEIVRPLWLNQAFFQEDVDGLSYHELCIYFLMDVSRTDLRTKGAQFTLREGKHVHTFEWLKFERLEQEYFYPLFLKRTIFTCLRLLPCKRNWNSAKRQALSGACRFMISVPIYGSLQRF